MSINKAKKLIEKAIKELSATDMGIIVTQSTLEKAIEELNKSDWVSVEDELPPYCKNVLVIPNGDKANPYVTARVRSHNSYELDANGFIKMMPFLTLPITHWKYIDKQ